VSNICTVIAIFTPMPEHADSIRAMLLLITPMVHEEAGCEFYTLNEDVEGRLIYVEAWSTRQHWIDHMEEPTVKQILAGVEGKLQKEVEVYELYNVPAGTSGKGSLAQATPTA